MNQINPGEIEVVAGKEESFPSESGSAEDLDFDFSVAESDADAASMKRSSKCAGKWLWMSLGALLFTAFVMLLGGAFGGIAAANYQQAQASKDNSGSKAGKSEGSGGKSGKRGGVGSGGGGDPGQAEEPSVASVRAKLTGSVTVGDLDCGDEQACVQSAQNALKAWLEGTIVCPAAATAAATDSPIFASPCFVSVLPDPVVSSPGETLTDEGGRRRLQASVESLWTYIAYLTVASPVTQTTIDEASSALLTIVQNLVETTAVSITVAVAEVNTVFENLLVDLETTGNEWAEIAVGTVPPGYQLVGDGFCRDSGGLDYGAFTFESGLTLPQCFDACENSGCFAAYGGVTLVAIGWDDSNCICFVSDVDDALGDGSCSEASSNYANYGNGGGEPWFSGPDGSGNFCYRPIPTI